MATNMVDINTTISIITLIQKEGGGFGIGNMCTPVADACWCMAKPIQYRKVKNNNNKFLKKEKKTFSATNFPLSTALLYPTNFDKLFSFSLA